MFYEMCFPFSTNMERIYVISNLRKETIEFVNNIDFQAYEKQVFINKYEFSLLGDTIEFHVLLR